jgi:hypothetical protein
VRPRGPADPQKGHIGAIQIESRYRDIRKGASARLAKDDTEAEVSIFGRIVNLHAAGWECRWRYPPRRLAVKRLLQVGPVRND